MSDELYEMTFTRDEMVHLRAVLYVEDGAAALWARFNHVLTPPPQMTDRIAEIRADRAQVTPR